jgi:invasion protein IalB
MNISPSAASILVAFRLLQQSNYTPLSGATEDCVPKWAGFLLERGAKAWTIVCQKQSREHKQKAA